MQCFRCGETHDLASGERVGFRDACACGTDLHVCRNCHFYDASAYNQCREPNAERVSDRERANRCDYFQAGEGSAAGGEAGGAAKDALDALFRKP